MCNINIEIDTSMKRISNNFFAFTSLLKNDGNIMKENPAYATVVHISKDTAAHFLRSKRVVTDPKDRLDV